MCDMCTNEQYVAIVHERAKLIKERDEARSQLAALRAEAKESAAGWVDGRVTKPKVGERVLVCYKGAVQCGSYWDTWSGERRDNWCRDQSSVYFPETEPDQPILWQRFPPPPGAEARARKAAEIEGNVNVSAGVPEPAGAWRAGEEEVERVAKALSAHMHGPDQWARHPLGEKDTYHEHWRGYARAAIAALRGGAEEIP